MVGGTYYDKTHRESKERASFKKRIKKLHEDLLKLPPAQLNRVLGFDKEGSRIEKKDAYQEADRLANFLSNHVGLAADLIEETKRLYTLNNNLQDEIKVLERQLKEKTGLDFSAKIELGSILEQSLHKLYLIDQFICPKCKEAGLPLYWEGRWLWCHFRTPSIYSWKKPTIKIHQIKKGELGNWWLNYEHMEEYENCLIYGGRACKILSSFLIKEGYKRTSELTVGRWNPETRQWEGGLNIAKSEEDNGSTSD